MSNRLEKFRNLDYCLPEKNLAWRMYKAGVENFGKGGVDSLPLHRPGKGEVLLRVDAIGICFSDVKLITQGSTHPRIPGRDLVANPVVAGHEVSLTVVEAGDNYKEIYKPGQRFIMQADIYFHGANLAFGYFLQGGMEQYVMVGEEVLAGDEGAYLIPIKGAVGYSEAALVEPWTCVVASYRIHPRKALLPGGFTLVVQAGAGGFTFETALAAEGAPAKVVTVGVDSSVRAAMRNLCPSAEVIELATLKVDNIKGLVEERTGGKGFDDIIVLGTPDADVAEALSAVVARNGVMAIVASDPISRLLQIDVGRVHYDYIDFVGTSGGKVSDAYTKSRDSELTAGGTAWFIGAAGPMGQMHVQRAASMANGPKEMLCTDVDNDRLSYLKDSLTSSLRDGGPEVVFLNPIEAGNDGLANAISEMTGGKGFDDIVVLAPVSSLISSAIPHLASGGMMNIFAGVPRGTIATIDLSCTFMKGNRFVGSSGSRPNDMVDTLQYTIDGELPTRHSMAAVGGIDAMADGVMAVKQAKFPGKTVIFPHIHLPLTALTDLNDVLPNVYAKLENGKFWTNEAEEELLESKLEI